MQTIILCGGKGTRMQGINDMPKPMQLVNGKPIIHHIMNQYKQYGKNDFVLPIGYKGEKIKQYFIDYEWNNCNFKKSIGANDIELMDCDDDFSITLIDAGLETMTGARIKKMEKYINSDVFMVTYGDALSDIDINKLLEFHKKSGKIATVTGIRKKSQYGILEIEGNLATSFSEKSAEDGIINGGFFVFSRKMFDYLGDDINCVLEEKPLQKLISDQQLSVYMHEGFWLSIDTQKDLQEANKIWTK